MILYQILIFRFHLSTVYISNPNAIIKGGGEAIKHIRSFLQYCDGSTNYSNLQTKKAICESILKCLHCKMGKEHVRSVLNYLLTITVRIYSRVSPLSSYYCHETHKQINPIKYNGTMPMIQTSTDVQFFPVFSWEEETSCYHGRSHLPPFV